MPEFAWEPVEFLEALGVVPEEEEHGTSYHYVVRRSDLRLELTVWPMSADVALSLFAASQPEPIASLRLLNCPGARVVSDKRGKFIEFVGANLFVGRYDRIAPAPYGFRVWVEPYLQVVPFAYST
jgi:hypothetical protein